jgi:protein-tyrosine phosphatase/membrane-associated phospholipid phosphatase
MGHLHRVGGLPRRELIHAAWTSALLSALFVLVYGTTNWIATQHADLPTWYFAWELAIPFVPLFIVPYMSIDLFFVAAPFVCSDQSERRVLAGRITFAILVAGAIFLLMPLRLAYERLPVDGVLGVVFDTFRSMDAPHNLFPSLHIALRVILADTYARHTRGPLRFACAVWFSLIGFSTVLTYQHHLVDIAGGAMLAAFAFHLVRPAVAWLPVTSNLRIAAYYSTGALVLLVLAWPLRPWGALLLWPTGALAIVAAGYSGAGPGIWRKHAGRLPLSTRVVLGPVQLGQYLSLLYYRRRCRPWDEVAPGVLIGRQLTGTEAAEAVRQGVTAVLDLTGEFSEATPLLRVHYRNLPILDLTAPTPEQLREAVDFIAQEASRGTVYVHCKIGYSRSAAVVGAYLLAKGQVEDAAAAIALLRRMRPTIVVRAEARQALSEFESALGPVYA